MATRAFPNPLRCAECKKTIGTDAPLVILVTVALNPEKTGAAARGEDFDGVDAALCSLDCMASHAHTLYAEMLIGR